MVTEVIQKLELESNGFPNYDLNDATKRLWHDIIVDMHSVCLGAIQKTEKKYISEFNHDGHTKPQNNLDTIDELD